METIQIFRFEASSRKLAKGGQTPLCEHAGDLTTWALGANVPLNDPRAQMFLSCCVDKAQEPSHKVLRLWSASPKGSLAAADMTALIWMGTGHIKSKEKLIGRLETVGLGHDMRMGLEGKKGCQPMSQRNNWGFIYKSCYVSGLQL